MNLIGNKLLNAEAGNVSVFDTSAFPAQYVSPQPGVSARKDEFRRLLGL